MAPWRKGNAALVGQWSCAHLARKCAMSKRSTPRFDSGAEPPFGWTGSDMKNVEYRLVCNIQTLWLTEMVWERLLWHEFSPEQTQKALSILQDIRAFKVSFLQQMPPEKLNDEIPDG